MTQHEEWAVVVRVSWGQLMRRRSYASGRSYLGRSRSASKPGMRTSCVVFWVGLSGQLPAALEELSYSRIEQLGIYCLNGWFWVGLQDIRLEASLSKYLSKFLGVRWFTQRPELSRRLFPMWVLCQLIHGFVQTSMHSSKGCEVGNW